MRTPFKESDSDKLKYIKEHPLLVKDFAKLYNGLCRKCKGRSIDDVVHNRKVNPNKWCDECKKILQERFGEA